jgi:hypothetical protein
MQISNGVGKNLNINFKFSKANFFGLFKNLSWLFLVVFLVLLAFEAVEIQTSVSLIIQLNQTPTAVIPKKNAVASIDFATYQKNLQRVQDAKNFTVTDGITYDPFNGLGSPPAPGSALGAPTSTPVTTSTLPVSGQNATATPKR